MLLSRFTRLATELAPPRGEQSRQRDPRYSSYVRLLRGEKALHSIAAQLIVGPLFVVAAIMWTFGRKRLSRMLRRTTTQSDGWSTSPGALLVVGVAAGALGVYLIVDALFMLRGA